MKKRDEKIFEKELKNDKNDLIINQEIKYLSNEKFT